MMRKEEKRESVVGICGSGEGMTDWVHRHGPLQRLHGPPEFPCLGLSAGSLSQLVRSVLVHSLSSGISSPHSFFSGSPHFPPDPGSFFFTQSWVLETSMAGGEHPHGMIDAVRPVSLSPSHTRYSPSLLPALRPLLPPQTPSVVPPPCPLPACYFRRPLGRPGQIVKLVPSWSSSLAWDEHPATPHYTVSSPASSPPCHPLPLLPIPSPHSLYSTSCTASTFHQPTVGTIHAQSSHT
jgi:hypothetical protein